MASLVSREAWECGILAGQKWTCRGEKEE